MDPEKLKKLNEVILNIKSADNLFFYNKIALDLNSETDVLRVFKDLPTTDYLKLSASDLGERLYRKGELTGKFVKVIRNYKTPFLVQRNLSDIQQENYGIACMRPQVLLSDSHDALEKSLWFYENNILPLIGEPNNLDVSAFSAKKYGIDFLLTNPEMIGSYWPILREEVDVTKIKVNLLSSSFDANTLKKLLPEASSLQLILALPEVGAFAHSCPEQLKKGRLFFHPDKNSVLEILNNYLIVTKIIFMPTPIIRYQTTIRAYNEKNKHCSCGNRELSFSIER
jgi:hypothetical protein